MDRRKFVTTGSMALFSIPMVGFSRFDYKQFSLPKPQWMVQLIQLNDQHLKNYPAIKVKDKAHIYYGGYYNGYEIPNPGSTWSFVIAACVAISCSESSNYRSVDLLKEIKEAIECLLKMQHEDGTIDLLDTNFHSTPDTGFMVKRIVPAYTFLKKSGTPGSEPVLALFEKLLLQAGECLVRGGIHTPNHRWVVSAALTQLNNVWPNPRYVARIEEWLSEHIDLDPDGQYNEKSTYGYSGVVDRVLITISKGLNKPWILDAVRKNLKMMRYYLHPNGEVVTEASSRQDKGQIGTMENYYYPLRYLALLDNDGEFAAMCRLIEKTSFNSLAGFLIYFLEDETIYKELPADKPLPVNYVKAFPYSGVVRMRKADWDATLLSSNPAWLNFHKEKLALQGMRVAASFFGKGQFQTEAIEQNGNSWVLKSKLDGPYYQPYPKDKIDPNGDLNKMPRSLRAKSEVQYLDTTVTVTPNEKSLVVDIDMKGTDGVPVTLELIFRRGGEFQGVQAHPTQKDAYLFAGKEAVYSKDNQQIKFGPGKIEHKWLQLRGALPAMDAPTVYITGYTPFKHQLELS
jgi:hypothetical protein